MLEVLGNKFVAQPLFDSDKSPSGLLFIPDQAKERCDQGIVKYCGPECKWVKPGDYVLFSGYTGTLVQLEGEDLVIIVPEDFVTAKIKPPATEISGLFCETPDGEFFPTTYESAIALIARGIQDAPWYKKLDIKHEVPRKGEVTWK